MNPVSLLVSHPLSHILLSAWVTDPTPQDKDVKAGWTAFAVFLLLVAAVVVLLISFTRQIRKVNAADKAGVYGSDGDPAASEDTDTPAPH